MNDYKELVENMRNNGDCITADIIEQLSINNDLLKKECDGLALQYGKCASNYTKLQIEYDTLAKMYAKVNEDLCVRTKERDAAMSDLTVFDKCKICKHYDEKSANYGYTEFCEICGAYPWADDEDPNKWEWRGVQNE